MKIEVSNCHECPFVDYEIKYGYYGCRLNHEIQVSNFEYNEITGQNKQVGEMPKTRVHVICPLHESSVLVKLK